MFDVFFFLFSFGCFPTFVVLQLELPPPGFTDGARVQREGAGTGGEGEGAGGKQPKLQRRPDQGPCGAAEKCSAVEGRDQESGAGL